MCFRILYVLWAPLTKQKSKWNERSTDLGFVSATLCQKVYRHKNAHAIQLKVSWETSTTHFKLDFDGSWKNTWHSDGFSHRISRSPNTSQSFVLKVNTTLSSVTGNTAQPCCCWLTTGPCVWSHTATHVYSHIHANAFKRADARHATAPCNPLWPMDRKTCVCLFPLSPLGLPLMPHSHCPSPSHSADWLPLPLSCRSCHLPCWHPHTHVINSFSSGLQKYRKFPRGLLHWKEMSVYHCHTLALTPHYIQRHIAW